MENVLRLYYEEVIKNHWGIMGLLELEGKKQIKLSKTSFTIMIMKFQIVSMIMIVEIEKVQRVHWFLQPWLQIELWFVIMIIRIRKVIGFLKFCDHDWELVVFSQSWSCNPKLGIWWS